MKNKKLSAILILGATLSLISCYNTPCGSDELRFGLIGFSDAEAQNIVIRKYNKNGQFTQKIDSIIFLANFSRSNDTLIVTANSTPGFITSSYDYEFFIPVIPKIIRISNMTEQKSEMKKSIFKNTKEMCINAITQLEINGQTLTPPAFNFIYLRK